jgi:hypothetical protein
VLIGVPEAVSSRVNGLAPPVPLVGAEKVIPLTVLVDIVYGPPRVEAALIVCLFAPFSAPPA